METQGSRHSGLDDVASFDFDDTSAIRHVRRAREGSSLHQDALALHARYPDRSDYEGDTDELDCAYAADDS